MPNRREVLKASAAAVGAIATAPYLNFGRFDLFGDGRDYSERAIRLVHESVVIDMLNQFKIGQFKRDGESIAQLWRTKPSSFTEADAQRYLESGISIFALGHGVGSFEEAIRFFAEWNGFIAENDHWFKRIDSADDFEHVKSSGRIGLMLTLQNSSHFRTEEDVDTLYGLGQRVSQLTYNNRNRLGNGAFMRGDKGLSDFGLRIVERMNRVGMAMDVSHCGDRTTLDAFSVSQKPVLITHANCRALNPGHVRAKTDEAIRAMAKGDGVMGISFIRFMVRDREPTTVEHVLDHFDYVAKLVGVEHVGIGSDFDLDGFDAIPEERAKIWARADPRYRFRVRDQIEGVDHEKRVYDLTEGLIRRNYSDTDIRLILGGNFQRTLASIWS